MREITHVRRGRHFWSADGVHLVKECESINAAKRHSRMMQKPGVVDRWVVKTEPHQKAAPQRRKFKSYAEKRRAPKAKVPAHDGELGAALVDIIRRQGKDG